MGGASVLGLYFLMIGLPVMLAIGFLTYERHLKVVEEQLRTLTQQADEVIARYAAYATDRNAGLSAQTGKRRDASLN